MKKILICLFIACIGVVIYKKFVSDVCAEVWTHNEVNGKIEAFKEPAEAPLKSELYIDASGSMKPYFFATNTTMSNSISEFLNLDEKGTDVYFIGSNKKHNGLVAQIITNVKNQPNLASTSFDNFFMSMSAKADSTNSIIYLVTDGIMSINGVDMKTALTQMMGKVKNSLSKSNNIAAAIFRYKSGYKGQYWNCMNHPIVLSKEMSRPYYIIALGKKEVIRWLSKQDDITAKGDNAYYMGIHDYKAHNILKLDKSDSAKLEKPGETIKLSVDLPECLSSMDVSKAVVKINNKTVDGIPLTYSEGKLTATLDKSIAVPGGNVEVSIGVPNEIPTKWTKTWNCDDDLKGPDETTTFGLSSLVKGMYKALESDTNMLSITFKFNKSI